MSHVLTTAELLALRQPIHINIEAAEWRGAGRIRITGEALQTLQAAPAAGEPEGDKQLQEHRLKCAEEATTEATEPAKPADLSMRCKMCNSVTIIAAADLKNDSICRSCGNRVLRGTRSF